MDRRGWVLGIVVVAVLGVGLVLAFRHWGSRAARTPEQLSPEQMLDDPSRPAEDRAAAAVTRLGGSVARDDRARQGQHVSRADLGGCKVTDADLKELAGLEWLQTLNLSGTQVTDDGLRELQAFRYVQNLDLSKTSITGAGLSNLGPLTLMRRLSLAETKVSDSGLAALSAIPSLQDLDLAGTSVSNAGIAALKPLTRLDTLNLARTKVTGAVPVGDLGIRMVDLTDVPMTADEYMALRALKARPTAETPIPGQPAAGPGNGTGPPPEVDLVVRGVRSVITDDWLKALAAADKLDLLVEKSGSRGRGKQPNPKTEVHILNLSGSRVTDAGLRGLKGFDGFTALDLSGTAVTDAGLAELSGHRTLTALTLDRTRVTNAGLKHLRDLKGLRSLSLKKTGVTDAGLKDVGALAALRQLDLEGTAVTNKGLADLKALDQLAALHVGGTRVTENGVADFKKARPKCEIRR